MRLSWEQLKHLPVVTRSGQALGNVVGFVSDPETHTILQYEVRRGMPLIRTTLLIATAQVVGITAKRMTVEDSVLKGITEDEAAKIAATEASTGSFAATRKISAP